MHDLSFIRSNRDYCLENFKNRGLSVDLDKIISLDHDRRSYINEMQSLQKKKNEIVKKISLFNKDKILSASEGLIKESQDIEYNINNAKNSISNIEAELNSILSYLPNFLSSEVPYGTSEQDNKEIKKYGDIPDFDFKCKSHDQLGINLGMMDFINAAKLSGSRFVILKDDLAMLERAISDFMLDENISNGYIEISPPLMVKNHTMYGVGQLPKFENDSFSTQMELRLIPTAEVPLTSIVADSIISKNDLPLRFVARTPCFRSEAGSAGKDTKGMLRQHQFLKVELVAITTADQSYAEFDHLTFSAEKILRKLEIPYRKILLCSADTGFSSSITYDLEVWLPSVNKYREVSSCSNCLDFQGRRMNSRYKDNNKKYFVHTMNGSALAVGRTMIAILENYQQKDGSIKVPKALIPYMKGQDIIQKK
ncbi:serine--tRNA ligase [Anaplasmataceae bacterium AB001_6]|nr:serine--tRNA ligase [Anaplasmataceae bacterium AB001_6]